ncbi:MULTISPECIES: rhomboid family intramembrane serine protease [unclassified Corynebacterium]|uniref:rhomboid family intramembrane serine protease n=1 Tax=unclassified Corynebacterium TaxID=2624378 RepID=UPI0029CA2DE5|nr:MULTISPECIES: rhomboid family intramembrane serine protease [unclassified Corynebacterium]WPF65716.1 rhomboid family intramembrane serine protease [Corynebacterium sp. 22KM0430]WPF68211.1 rhomboid family intramembrane serine protease [Corynebacterium sp. 21KM1197]
MTPGARLASGLSFAAAYVVVIWAVHIINDTIFGGALVAFGVHPRDPSSLWGVFTAPLLHGSYAHLMSNTVPGAIFSFLIGVTGPRTWWEVTGIVLIFAGMGMWLFGGVGTTHVGASGMVYGWLTYLVIRGLFNRSLRQILLGLVLGSAYSYLIWGVLPAEGVSWQGHFFGALGGLVAAMVITSDDPQPRTKQVEPQPL